MDKYKEALEKAKKLYEQGTITESLTYIFPELKESDGERIKQSIIADIKSKMNNCTHTLDDYYREQISWLEKQGEQKSTIEMKSVEESLGIDSETYNKIVDECIYGDNKQKPAWSEEDEKFFNDTIVFFRDTKNALDHTDWLESLKQRICGKIGT